MRAVWVTSGLVLLGAVLAGCTTWDGALTSMKRGGASGIPAVGKQAPDIEGEDLDGKRFTLADYRGKVVMLDFWGMW